MRPQRLKAQLDNSALWQRPVALRHPKAKDKAGRVGRAGDLTRAPARRLKGYLKAADLRYR